MKGLYIYIGRWIRIERSAILVIYGLGGRFICGRDQATVKFSFLEEISRFFFEKTGTLNPTSRTACHFTYKKS